MQRISVVLAVFNEENYLDQCLESVKDFAWETVIVDGGSTDGTLKIAKKYKAAVVSTNNPKNFHINKNKAIDKAKGDWVLQLDADEVVTKDLKKEILEKVNDITINGFWIPRKNYFLGKFLTKGGQYPDYTLRLYRKGKGRLPAEDVHEQAVVEGEKQYLKHDLLHVRDKSFSEYMYRFNRYTSLIAIQMRDSGVTISTISFLNYILFKPFVWFVKVYFRHRGYVDGFPGFVFAFFSSLRFSVAYIKMWSSYKKVI